jgi:hypothetical protein
MEKNKTGKYLKYAIGEIILVVIGILLALQVNNWNIERKNETKAQVLSENLLDELKSIRRLTESRLEGIERQKNLIQYLVNNSKINMDTVSKLKKVGNIEIDILNYLFSFKYHLSVRADVYNNAINEGSLRLLKNQDLASDLNSIYILSVERTANHTVAENNINTLLNEHISNKYEAIFATGLLDSNTGIWNEVTSQKILEEINSDGKLKYLLSSKLHILQFKVGDLKYRALNIVDRAISKLEGKE